jgi:hypothetical protein
MPAFRTAASGAAGSRLAGTPNNTQHVDLKFLGASHEVLDLGVTHFRETECIDFQRVEAELLHLFKVWHVVHIPFRAPVAVENAYFVHAVRVFVYSSWGLLAGVYFAEIGGSYDVVTMRTSKH